MTKVLLSICIPVRNDPGNLKQCLSGFRNQDLSDCEIIVCDDGSEPPIGAADLADTGVTFTLVRQRAQGPSAARNQLARLARGVYLLFVDADTVPERHILERAKGIITEQPKLAAFYGSYDDEPASASLISSYRNLLHHYTHQHSANGQEKVTTFWCGCGVIRRDLYLQMGGLSEFYEQPSIEDIELGNRLSARGIDIRIFPHLQVKHLKKWTLRTWLYTDVFCRAIPWVRLMRATNAWTSQLNFSWVQRISTLAAGVVVLGVVLSPLSPRFVIPAGLAALATFLILNLPFVNLVRRKRGLTIAIAVVPLHLVYALICLASMAAAFLYPPLKLPQPIPLLPKERNVST